MFASVHRLAGSSYSWAITAVLLLGWPLAPARAADQPDPAADYTPEVAAASDAAQRAMRRIHVSQDLEVELFAAEPMLANPVAFCIDGRGRFYVAETFRLHAGVTDNRWHMNWLADDLACRTVADRLALYRKHLGNDFATLSVEHDRVRLIEDTDGDGRADRATVFADGFHDAADGIAAGLLARGDDVWFTCIPHLWRLRDTDGDRRADQRIALQSGYGVHVSFIGHDLHGLKFGPDGKLYFSIGDRGFHVEQQGQTLACPDTGAVLRCNPDGSRLEVVHIGLRNPQELAFDEWGNLFTADNNSDGGDKARWVHVVEGGDSGWRIGYQYLNTPHRRGPWNAEKLWLPAPEGDAASIVPPLANFGDGPSGLAYYPGTGLSDRYRGCFFLCDFRGAAGLSGVRTLRLKPHGATFAVVDTDRPIWSLLATDLEFGPDGALYVSDWVEGWEKTGKGRIYRFFDPKTAGSAELAEVRRLLTEPMAARSVDQLVTLLSHADMRVRQEAQFALAARGESALPALEKLAQTGSHRLARIHALWALGQIGPDLPDAASRLPALTADGDDEIRAQAAKVLGDLGVAGSRPQLVSLLDDPQPRVAFCAALALGKLRAARAVPPLVELLRRNADQDRYLRHAAVMGLVGCADAEALRKVAADDSPAVRMGALLAMRRQTLPDVARFLDDPEPALVVEAARAIYDVPIQQGYLALAAIASDDRQTEPVRLRSLAANAYLGDADSAVRLAGVAASEAAFEMVRLEALEALAEWGRPQVLDRLLGQWRPRPPRDTELAVAALTPHLNKLLEDRSEKVREATVVACGRLGVAAAGPALAAVLFDNNRPSPTRVAALHALGQIGSPELTPAVQRAIGDADAAVRRESLRLLAKISPAEALPVLEAVLQKGTTAEQQGAFDSLRTMPGTQVERLLLAWLDRLLAGQVEPAVQLDLIEAASGHPAADIRARLGQFEAARQTDDPLAPFREALAGGDAARGETIFFERTAAACLRCHKIDSRGGEVGPDLTHVAKDKSREYLLEALVAPNRQIAAGFESVLVSTTNGQTFAGVLKAEDEHELRLVSSEGLPIVIAKSDIEDRQRGPSAMPDDIMRHLTKRDLRDLVEFLAGQD